MLQLKNIRKAYKTDDFTQVALDDVSVTFRDSEFVAILGPSGSGKTTMLNILGGLDHADSGEIVINGVSTKDYSSKDWDTYRNHRVGFVFQSYNLIPHQTVLSNVELALTLAGVGRAERRRRATEALAAVGLADHVRKRPAQLSGLFDDQHIVGEGCLRAQPFRAERYSLWTDSLHAQRLWTREFDWKRAGPRGRIRHA